MSEPEPAGWDPSFGEGLWRDTRSSGRDRPPQEGVDHFADHIDSFWGDRRPEPEPDASSRLLEAVWGPQVARERTAGEDAATAGPEQLSLFDLPPAGGGPAT